MRWATKTPPTVCSFSGPCVPFGNRLWPHQSKCSTHTHNPSHHQACSWSLFLCGPDPVEFLKVFPAFLSLWILRLIPHRTHLVKPSNSASCDHMLLIELHRHEILTVCLSGSPPWKSTVHPWSAAAGIFFFLSWMEIKGAKAQIALSRDAEVKRHCTHFSFMPSWR